MNKLFPVIHLVDKDQLSKNINTCLEVGVNQVFIINHLTDHRDLLFHALKIKDAYPELWIGLNFLDLDPMLTLNLDIPFEGLWIDKTLTKYTVNNRVFNKEIFSGLNFKYQKQFSGDDLVEAVEIIKQTSTVACTSGPGTGQHASLQKIEKLKELLEDFPLALASGVSSSNVESYLPYVDHFLVASSITDHNEIIDKDKLKELKDKIQ